jgi:hypothetical protein
MPGGNRTHSIEFKSSRLETKNIVNYRQLPRHSLPKFIRHQRVTLIEQTRGTRIDGWHRNERASLDHYIELVVDAVLLGRLPLPVRFTPLNGSACSAYRSC